MICTKFLLMLQKLRTIHRYQNKRSIERLRHKSMNPKFQIAMHFSLSPDVLQYHANQLIFIFLKSSVIKYTFILCNIVDTIPEAGKPLKLSTMTGQNHPQDKPVNTSFVGGWGTPPQPTMPGYQDMIKRKVMVKDIWSEQIRYNNNHL